MLYIRKTCATLTDIVFGLLVVLLLPLFFLSIAFRFFSASLPSFYCCWGIQYNLTAHVHLDSWPWPNIHDFIAVLFSLYVFHISDLCTHLPASLMISSALLSRYFLIACILVTSFSFFCYFLWLSTPKIPINPTHNHCHVVDVESDMVLRASSSSLSSLSIRWLVYISLQLGISILSQTYAT